MGSFYTNITLKDANPEAVLRFLQQEGRRAYVAALPAPYCVVYDAESETQVEGVLEEVSRALSAEFECAALSVLVHDDDFLNLALYDSGVLKAHYISGAFLPAWSCGNVLTICKAFDRAPAAISVWLTLALPDMLFVFASNRLARLAYWLGLPSAIAGTGFNYIRQGEIPETLSETELVPTREEDLQREEFVQPEGVPSLQPILCPECMASNPPGANFCMACGKSLSGAGELITRFFQAPDAEKKAILQGQIEEARAGLQGTPPHLYQTSARLQTILRLDPRLNQAIARAAGPSRASYLLTFLRAFFLPSRAADPAGIYRRYLDILEAEIERLYPE